ncbi:MAG: energy transducer TonB [Cypionkella sp.]|nr:energy transducer TonB [Cypionkella sp.]
MSARVQAGLALMLAAGLHVAAFALRPQEAGAVASGAGGADLVSLQAADASLAALVEDWDRPPQPQVEMPPDLAPPAVAELAAPEAPAPAPPVPLAAPVLAAPDLALPHMAEAPLAAEVSLPPPAPEPAPQPELAPDHPPQPKVRPEPRPRDLARPKPAPEPKAQPQPREAAKPAATAPRQTASAGQAAQRAAGTGGGAQAGDSGSAQAATLSKARVNDLKAGWGATIRARIERRKSYPAAARGASGSVTVRLTVSRTGQLAGVSVAKSSGNAALDQAALRAVQAAGSFPAAPKGLTDASYAFTLPMKFSR